MSFKHEKLNQAIKKELGGLILKELDIPSDIVITITRVECSGNFFFAKVFVSIIPEDKKEFFFKLLTKKASFFQRIINKRLRIRPVPKIEFVLEGKIKQAARIEELLKKIKDLEKNKEL